MLKIAAWMAVPILLGGLAGGARAQQTTVTAAQLGPLYGEHGVTPEAVRQGTLGSCFFHASIAALAKSSPETLRGAISRNPDGGYRVHFVSGPDEAVYAEDLEYGRQHSFDRSEGNWVLVLMRGYAQRALRESLVAAIEHSAFIPVFVRPMALSMLDQSGQLLVAYDRAIRSVVSQDGELDKAALKKKLASQLSQLGIPDMQAQMLGGFLDEKGFFDALALTVQQNGEVFGAYKSLGQGGIPVRVIEAFLGGAGAGQTADRPKAMEQLRRMRLGNVAMVAGTWGTPHGPEGQDHGSDWWVPGHSYTVMGYDEATETVSLRNPWGARPGPDGNFTLPIAVFLRNFESFSYSEPSRRGAGERSASEQ